MSELSPPNVIESPGASLVTAQAVAKRGKATGTAFIAADRPLLGKVLAWLALALLITTIGAGIAPLPWNASIDLIGNGLPLLIVTFIVSLGLLIGINRSLNAGRTRLAAGLFFAFALAEGLFIGPVVWSYINDGAYDTVSNALLATFGVFLVAAAVVWLTSRSFAAWGRWLLTVLVIGIALSLAALVVPIPQLALNLGIGIVFMGLTIFDFWRVRTRAVVDRSGILLAVNLYLDFINLFLIALRLFGRRR